MITKEGLIELFDNQDKNLEKTISDLLKDKNLNLSEMSLLISEAAMDASNPVENRKLVKKVIFEVVDKNNLYLSFDKSLDILNAFLKLRIVTEHLGKGQYFSWFIKTTSVNDFKEKIADIEEKQKNYLKILEKDKKEMQSFKN